MAADDSETHECPVPSCGFVAKTMLGRGNHFGMSHTEKVKRRTLRDALSSFVDELGHVPSQAEMDDDGPFSSQAYRTSFGSWSDALKKCGYTLKQYHTIPEEQLLAEIQRLGNELNKVPAKRDMTKHSRFGYTAVRNHFGCWNNALEAAGFDPKHVPGSGDEEYIRYGSNWLSMRETVVDRDDSTCRVCGTTSSMIESQSVHVHHITPAREFGAHDPDVDTDYEKMNDPSNLVCLCPSCHRTLEGKFQDVAPSKFAELGQEQLDIANTSVAQTSSASD